ncbi:hypothetical protein N7528_007994 [Penicillium herquei]|nr:hypothetical protein N7528_007994 [Penicillium herquei]
MRQRFELGQCLLHDTTSQIQLQFAAAATLSRPQDSNFKDSPISYWPDPLSTWIKEAPEIEMSLSLSFGSEITFISSHFVEDFHQRLCNSLVWSELGFTITCKGHNISTKPNFSEEIFLILGLVRNISKPVIEKTRNLPAMLQNLPDIPPPQAMPVISLATIEIFIECNYSTRTEESYHESDLLFGYEEPPSSLQDGLPSQASYIDPMAALGSNSLVYFQEPGTNHDMPHQHDTDQFSDSLLDLMDFGLQKLIVSPSFKTSHIQTHGDNLRNLRELAPAVFNPKYREAVNQRAASIPAITKAITSMLKNNSNPDLQPKFADSPQERIEWIKNSLWCKSQTLLPRPGPPRRRNRFFPPRLPASSPRVNIDADVAMPFTDDIFDEEILELDDDWEDIDINHGNMHGDLEELDDFIHTDIEEESDELLLRSSSQASFQDLYESTQTTLDSHQSSLEEVSSSQPDTEMLFCSLEHG